MIKAFFDESWNPNSPRMFAVAGILASVDEWDEIETGWRIALNEKNAELVSQGRKPISRYHSSEMNAKDGEFKGWSGPDNPQENAQFDQRMLSVIRGRKIFVISFAVVLDDMVKVFPEWAKDERGYAYGYSFLNCLLKFGRIAGNSDWFESGQQIKAWYDQCEWNGRVLDAFQKIKSDLTFSENWRFDTVTPDSSVTNVCLQVADMMVYDCWRESERVMYDGKRKMGKFFAELVKVEKHHICATYANERVFQELRKLLEKKIAAKLNDDQKAQSN